MYDDTKMGGGASAFPATRLTAIERARSAQGDERGAALETLIAVYWRPIYKYVRLRWRRSNEDAKDLTQEFFTRLLQSDLLERFDPTRARLRTFLRTCLDHMVQKVERDATRLKRGGGVELMPMDFVVAEAELARADAAAALSMEELFEREWVRSLFALAVEDLRADCARRGRELDFRLFERYDLAAEDGERPTYDELAAELDITAATVTNRLAAARRLFRRRVLDRLREMTGSEREYRQEARAVLGITPE